MLTATNRDVAEATPARSNIALRLHEGTPVELSLPAYRSRVIDPPAELTSYEYWRSVWLGQARDEEPIRKIVDTDAVVLMNVRKAEAGKWRELQSEAMVLWRKSSQG